MSRVDAVVIGSGPNGLVAATLLARAGWSVEVLEAAGTAGGAIASEPSPTPGITHDPYSAFFGVLHLGPVYAELELGQRVRWATTDIPVASASAPGESGIMYRDPARTAEGLGPDGPAWDQLMDWWRHPGRSLFDVVLGPGPDLVGAAPGLARLLARTSPASLADAAQLMLTPADAWARRTLRTTAAQALVAGHVTHADVAVGAVGSMPAVLLLTLAAQEVGMPVPVGGAGALAQALVGAAREAGAVVRTGHQVTAVRVRNGRVAAVETAPGHQVAVRRAVLADTNPLTLARELVGEQHFPAQSLQRLETFRRGTGYARLDVDLDLGSPGAATPWADPRLAEAGYLHLCGDLDTIAANQSLVSRGLLPEHPLLIVGQQDRADPTRVPPGMATLWLECHVPNTPPGGWADSSEVLQERMLATLEHYAPGVGARIVTTVFRSPDRLAERNANLGGGDVGGGSATLDQQAIWRPARGWSAYATPLPGLYLSSASAHPGGGAHGLAGRSCARRVLRDARTGWLGLRRRTARQKADGPG